MGPDELVPVLEKVDLFSGLKPKLLRTIAESGQVETFAPDEVVIAEGEEVGGFRPFSQKGVEMHIVLDGSGGVSVSGESHGTVGPGDYFGELSLLDGKPRSAEITAGEPGLTTFALTKWTFAELLEQHPEIALPMLRVLVERLRAAEHRH